MSAYKAANCGREILLVSAGINQGARDVLLGLARVAKPHLKATYVNAARDRHHLMIRDKRAARAP